jgi:hypothetical protein
MGNRILRGFMRKFIISLALACTVSLTIPIPAQASIVMGTVELIRRLFQVEDVKNTDWEEVGRGMGAGGLIDKITGEDEKKAQAAAQKNQNATPQKPEPRPKVRPAQYLVISFFVFFLIISSILLLWMATRRD